jgi:hypothetical protein
VRIGQSVQIGRGEQMRSGRVLDAPLREGRETASNQPARAARAAWIRMR